MLTVGIAGGTGSGKSTLATRLSAALGAENVAVVPHDYYYRNHPELVLEQRSRLNYDEPDAFEGRLPGGDEVLNVRQPPPPNPSPEPLSRRPARPSPCSPCS